MQSVGSIGGVSTASLQGQSLGSSGNSLLDVAPGKEFKFTCMPSSITRTGG